jgi:hypothetical protein
MATETQSQTNIKTMKKTAGDRPRPTLVKPKYKVNPQALEQLLTLDPDHPDYPLKKAPFEVSYQQLVAEPDDYQMRHSFAVAFISDPQGRYKKLRFLVEKFIPKGVEVTPEIQALHDDLTLRVREALLQRGDKKRNAAIRFRGTRRSE